MSELRLTLRHLEILPRLRAIAGVEMGYRLYLERVGRIRHYNIGIPEFQAELRRGEYPVC